MEKRDKNKHSNTRKRDREMYVVHPNLGVTSTKRASHLVTLDSLKVTIRNNIIAVAFFFLQHLQYFHWKLQTASLTLSLSSTVAVLSVPFTQAHSANCVGHLAYAVDLTIFYVFNIRFSAKIYHTQRNNNQPRSCCYIIVQTATIKLIYHCIHINIFPFIFGLLFLAE